MLGGGVKGMRIGVVKEGFGHPQSEAAVDAAVRQAAEQFASWGDREGDLDPDAPLRASRSGCRSAAEG